MLSAMLTAQNGQMVTERSFREFRDTRANDDDAKFSVETDDRARVSKKMNSAKLV